MWKTFALCDIFVLSLLLKNVYAAHPLCDFAQNTNMSKIDRLRNNRFAGWKCITGAETEEEICDSWTNLECHLGKVISIGLSNAGFNGTIPNSIGSLTSLRRLDLDSNNLHGTIPSSLGSLTRLNRLTLAVNSLTGTIPSQLGKLHQLRMLYFAHNNLTGTLPSSLAQLRKLNFLTVGHNRLSGSIPEAFGDSFVECTMELNDNHFSGEIPRGLCNAYQLYTYGNDDLVNNCEGYCRANGDCDPVGILHDKYYGRKRHRSLRTIAMIVLTYLCLFCWSYVEQT